MPRRVGRACRRPGDSRKLLSAGLHGLDDVHLHSASHAACCLELSADLVWRDEDELDEICAAPNTGSAIAQIATRRMATRTVAELVEFVRRRPSAAGARVLKFIAGKRTDDGDVAEITTRRTVNGIYNLRRMTSSAGSTQFCSN